MKKRDQRLLTANLRDSSSRMVMNRVAAVRFPEQESTTYDAVLLSEESREFYFKLAKNVLGAGLNKCLYEVNFSEGAIEDNGNHCALHESSSSCLSDDDILLSFAEDYAETSPADSPIRGTYFFISFTYTSPSKDELGIMDGQELDHRFIVAAFCPAFTSSGVFSIDSDGNAKSVTGNLISQKPIEGFVYPSFANGMSDVNKLLIFTKKSDSDVISKYSGIFGTDDVMSCKQQKESFECIVRDLFGESLTYAAYINVLSALETLRYDYDPSEDDSEITPDWLNAVIHRIFDGTEQDVGIEKVRSVFTAYTDDLPIYVSAVFAPKIQIKSDGIIVNTDYEHAKPIKFGKLTDGYEISAYTDSDVSIGGNQIY